MTSIVNIDRALEIGCGNGHGTRLIKKYFGPRLIDAVDLDEKMIEIAIRTNDDPSIHYKVMDASKLSFPDNAFDAIFDFGIIHHIPNWRDCISEMNRVLKNGGEAIQAFLTGRKETKQLITSRFTRAGAPRPSRTTR